MDAAGRAQAPRRYDSDMTMLGRGSNSEDSPTSHRGSVEQPRVARSSLPGLKGEASSSDREQGREQKRSFEKAQKKEVYAPLDPRILVSGIEVRLLLCKKEPARFLLTHPSLEQSDASLATSSAGGGE